MKLILTSLIVTVSLLSIVSCIRYEGDTEFPTAVPVSQIVGQDRTATSSSMDFPLKAIQTVAPLNNPPATSTNGDGSAMVSDQKPVVLWEKPIKESSWWLTANDANDQSKKIETDIRQRIQGRMNINFKQRPLSDAIHHFAVELQIPIFIDEKALQDESISPEEPITILLTDAQCSNALVFILEPLGLTYCIRNEALWVTVKNHGNVIRCYDLSAILPDNSLNGEILALIEQMVAPEEWQAAGGLSSMRILGSVLVVSTSEINHQSVAELLKDISLQATQNMKPARPKQSDTFTNGFIVPSSIPRSLEHRRVFITANATSKHSWMMN